MWLDSTGFNNNSIQLILLNCVDGVKAITGLKGD